MEAKTLAPDTLLAAARLAKPGAWTWFIPDERMKSCIVVNAAMDTPVECPVRLLRVENDMEDKPVEIYECFSLTNPADAYSLMIALFKARISIKYVSDGCWGYRYGLDEENGHYGFDTSEEAMLAAVETLEAMK